MKPLGSRKQRLTAESDLNRAQLVEDMTEFTAGVRAFTDRASSFGAMASAAALLVAGWAAFRRGKCKGTEAKISWLQTVLKGAGTVSSLWLACRRQGHDQKSRGTNPRL